MSRVEELVKEAASIAISGHIRPDGDCIGAVLSLYQYLRKNMPEKKVRIFLEEPAAAFSGIEAVKNIDSVMDDEGVYDVFFILDCSRDRIGKASAICDRAGQVINVDHHVSNEGTGDINILEPTASSTCEVVYGLLDPEKLDREIAQTLYLGLMHDTGVFKYSNTSPKTLRIVADLIGYGFDFSKLIDETFYEKSYEQNLAMGRALLDSKRLLDNRCIVSVMSRQTMEEYGVMPKDLDGIINQLRITKGVECAIFLYQTEEDKYKVSMRSNRIVNVAEVASCFGGGGHIRAAGCTLSGASEEIIRVLSAQIELQLMKAGEQK